MAFYRLDAQKFGLNVRKARENANMTQAQLGRAVYKSSDMIASIEIGRKAPGLETAALIAEELGVTVDDLLRQ